MNMKYYWPLNILFIVLAIGLLTLSTFDLISTKLYLWATFGVSAYGYVIWTMNDRHRKKYKRKAGATNQMIDKGRTN